MKHIDVKDPQYNEDGSILAFVLFEGNSEYWPFTASLDDIYPHTARIYRECASGVWGTVKPYTKD